MNYDPNGIQRLDLSLWKEPESEFYPVYAWIWNAGITKEGIDERLDAYEKAGVRGLYVLALPEGFRPSTAATELSPEYMSDEYLELVKYACGKAKKLGIALWLYDEGGWPSGGACGLTRKAYPECSVHRIKFRSAPLAKNTPYVMPSDTLSAFAGDRRVCDGYVSESDTEITEYFKNEEYGDDNTVNLMDPKVTEAFTAATHDRYAKVLGDEYGKSISMMFTDEPHLCLPAWTEGLEKAFAEKYGYDMLDLLPFIADRSKEATPEGARARIDFYELCGEYFIKNYLEPLRAACSKDGLLACGHLNGENCLESIGNTGYGSFVYALSKLDIPGIDAIWRQIFPRAAKEQKAGMTTTDPVDEGTVFFPRVAPSAAAYNGTTLSLSETFSVYGDGITPDEMRYAVNYQILRGVSVFNYMSSSYGEKNAHELFMRQSFSRSKPGFTFRKDFMKHTARLLSVCRVGKRDCDTLLYFPYKDVYASEKTRADATARYALLGKKLEEALVDFDIGDDVTLKDAYVDKAGLLHVGRAVYASLAVPDCEYMPENVRALYEKMKGKAPSPLAVCSDPDIRISHRSSDEESIYLVFNQGLYTVKAAVDFVRENGSGRNAYLLIPESGEVRRLDPKNIEVELPFGAIAAVVFTERILEEYLFCEKYEAKTEKPVPVSMTRFFFDDSDGSIAHTTEKCSSVPEGDASCELRFECGYSLDKAKAQGGTARLEILGLPENVSFFGEADIDGKKVGTFGESPAQVFFDASLLSESGKLGVTFSTEFAFALRESRKILNEKYGQYIHRFYDEKTSQYESTAPSAAELAKFSGVRLSIG